LNILESGLCKKREAELTAEVLGNPVTPDTYNWTFYDGSTATGESSLFTFPNNGDFNVALNATKNGCVEYHSQILTVHDLPKASYNHSFVSLDDTVQFTDLSVLGLQNPKHLFSIEGDFPVDLLITDNNTCQDDTTIVLTVNARPATNFNWENICYSDLTIFKDMSESTDGPITNWWWNFDDPASGGNNISTDQNPSHVFTAPGIYNVQLVVKAFGYDTISKQVQVYELPETRAPHV